MDYQTVINFWFDELEPKQWYIKSEELDQEIAKRFGETHQQAAKGGLVDWRNEALGCLAEIIVLDQFSRNMFRDDARAFAQDALAIELTRAAVDRGIDKQLQLAEKSFLYMPLMHSEELADHELAMQLFNQPGLENNLDYEIKHKVIIERFGRYPHRNAILNRESTVEEIEFLKQPGSSF